MIMTNQWGSINQLPSDFLRLSSPFFETVVATYMTAPSKLLCSSFSFSPCKKVLLTQSIIHLKGGVELDALQRPRHRNGIHFHHLQLGNFGVNFLSFFLYLIANSSSCLFFFLWRKMIQYLAQKKWTLVLDQVDEDLPLTYLFGTVSVLRDGSLDTSSKTPFGGKRSDSTYSGVYLSPGSNFTNYSVKHFSYSVI